MIGVHIVSILYEHFVNQGKYYHGMWLAGLTLAVLNRFIKMVLVFPVKDTVNDVGANLLMLILL